LPEFAWSRIGRREEKFKGFHEAVWERLHMKPASASGVPSGSHVDSPSKLVLRFIYVETKYEIAPQEDL
jgi:hypothetical protein